MQAQNQSGLKVNIDIEYERRGVVGENENERDEIGCVGVSPSGFPFRRVLWCTSPNRVHHAPCTTSNPIVIPSSNSREVPNLQPQILNTVV